MDVLSDSVGNRPLFNLATTLFCIISSQTMNGLNHVFATVPSSSAKKLLTLELPLDTDLLHTKASLSLKQMRYKTKSTHENLQKKQTTNIKDRLCLDICLLWPHEGQLIYVYNLLSLSLVLSSTGNNILNPGGHCDQIIPLY